MSTTDEHAQAPAPVSEDPSVAGAGVAGLEPDGAAQGHVDVAVAAHDLPDDEQWEEDWDEEPARDRGPLVVGSVLLVRVATVLLWMLVIGAVVLALVALVARPQRAAQEAPVVAPSDGDDGAAVQAAGFAQMAVRRYLGEAGQDSESAAADVLAGDVPDLHGVTPAGFFVSDAVTVGIEPRGDGYWAATVAVDLMAAVDGRYEPVGVRHYSVGVAVDEHGAATLADAPSQVAAPQASEAPDLLAGGLEHADDDDPQVVAVREFLAALLLGEGSIQRYTAPGTNIAAVSPPPFTALEIDQVAIVDPEAQRSPVRAAVLAVDANGLAQRLHYTVDLQLREGRWEVVELFSAPPLDEEPQAPPAAQGTNR